MWYFPPFTHSNGNSVNYRILTAGFSQGLAAGAAAMFLVAAVMRLFPNAWFGAWPLVMGMLPSFAALVARRSLLLAALPVHARRVAAPLFALLLPALLWVVYATSGGMPMLDGTSSVLQFVWMLLVGGVFGGLTVDAVAASAPTGVSDLRWNGALLLGIGAGLGAITIAQPSVPFLALWLLQVVLAAGVLVPAPEKRSDEADTGRKEKPRFLPAADPVLRLALPALMAFTIPFMLQTTAEMPLLPDGAPAILLAMLIAACGAGMLLARWWRRKFPHGAAAGNYSVLGGVVAAVLLAMTAGRYWSDLFSDVYTAWYAGATTAPGATRTLLLLALAMLALTMAASVRGAKAPGRLFAPILAGVSMAGVLAGMMLRATLDVHHVALFLIAPALLIALWEFVRWYQKTIVSAVLLAAILLAGYRAAPRAEPEFRNYFDAPRFQITGEERTPAGRLTLLQARDYDDRFYTLFWNQTEALTQSSRAVQNDLYRLGHLPMLMARPGARVLMLGLASTLPLEAVTMHAPASIDCVEPMAAALRVARTTMKTARPWHYLKTVRLFAERIPSFLGRTEQRYDVIVSAEPFAQPHLDPTMLTAPYFHAAAARLAEDGVFVQWLPVARMDVASMRRVFAAVLDAFPHTELWISSADPESAMIGVMASNRPWRKEQPAATAHARLLVNPEHRFHLQQIQLDRFAAVAACYGTDDAGVRRFVTDTTPFTLFDPVVSLRQRDPSAEAADVERLLAVRTPPSRFIDAQPDSVRTLARQILAARPAILRARLAAMRGDDSTTVTLLRNAVQQSPFNGEARRVFGDVMLRQAAAYVGADDHPTAIALLNGALQMLPLNTYMLRLYMIAAFNVGDREASGLAIDGIKRIDPTHAGFRDNQATIRARQGATENALLLYENAITLDQKNEEFYCNMASFHYSQGRSWEAIRVLDQATERSYYPAKPLYLKGMFYAEQGRVAFAIEAYERYLAVASPIDPQRVEVERRLADLRALETRGPVDRP
jgi:spermidine synthase/Flp pilus assembly protein TadD